jgi:protein SCO1/2
VKPVALYRRSSLLLLVAGLAGCRAAPRPAQDSVQTYRVRGVVIAADAAHNQLSLKTDEIPGFMAPMTMSYPLIDTAAYSELHTGDVITATLVVNPHDAGAMQLKDIVVIAQAKADYNSVVQYHVPAPGDAVPNFTVLNQSGRTVGLQQFHGKVLLMTFIYTRCTLSDYCPRMSRNFAEIDKALAADPKLYAQTHLLSISFDPKYDTPAVLKSYGSAYTGRYVHETFQHWDFAAPTLAELPKMEQYFDLGVTPGPNGILQHSLATLVVGKDGKVVAFYPTNDWAIADVLAKIATAASSPSS